MKDIDSTPNSNVWDPDPHILGGYIEPVWREEIPLVITRVRKHRGLAGLRWYWRTQGSPWDSWDDVGEMGGVCGRDGGGDREMLLCKCHHLPGKRRCWEDL